MSRSRILLLLFAALCGAVSYAWIATPRQRRISPGQDIVRQTPRQPDNKNAVTYPAVADLDFSGGGDHNYQAPRKNLFGPLYLPPKPVAKRPVQTVKVRKPVVQPQKIIPVVVTPPGPKPIPPLEVLGHLNKAGDITVFLSSRQGDLYLVKPGDMFADDLVVRNIGTTDIIVGRRQTDQQVTLQLGEIKSQRLPTVKFQSDRPSFEMPQKFGSDKPEQAEDVKPGTEKVEQ